MKNLCLFLTKSQKGAKKEPKRSQKGAERKEEIIAILAENPKVTQIKLMEMLELSRKQVQKEIKELQEQGVLVREGSNRGGKWIVKKN